MTIKKQRILIFIKKYKRAAFLVLLFYKFYKSYYGIGVIDSSFAILVKVLFVSDTLIISAPE